MQEYRIVTHFSEGITIPEPWNAFFFEPKEHGLNSDADPGEYIATLCTHLDAVGKLTTGRTESHAVAKLFLRKENKGHLTDNHKIFEQNTRFSQKPVKCKEEFNCITFDSNGCNPNRCNDFKISTTE